MTGSINVGIVFLTLRLDPQHAMEAGCTVTFTPLPGKCDICEQPITHKIKVLPMPMALLDANTLLYFPAEWAFCDACYTVKNDREKLAKRYDTCSRIFQSNDMKAALINTWFATRKGYRPKDEALAELTYSRSLFNASPPYRPNVKVVTNEGDRTSDV